MEKISRDKLKKKGFKRFLMSFKNSWDGLAYSYKNEQSLWIHGVCTIFCILFGLALNISFTEWAIILIALGVTLGMELVNTAIEAAVDLVTLEIHPLAKIAKDCGSAATFIMSMISVVIGLIIFAPKIIHIFF